MKRFGKSLRVAAQGLALLLAIATAALAHL